MKTTSLFRAFFATIVALFVISLTFTSCTKDDESLIDGNIHGNEKPEPKPDPVDPNWILSDAFRKDCAFWKDSTHTNIPEDKSVILKGLKTFDLKIEGTWTDKNQIKKDSIAYMHKYYNVELAATVSNHKSIIRKTSEVLPDSIEMKDGKFTVCQSEMNVTIAPVSDVALTVMGGNGTSFEFSTAASSADYRLETTKITRMYLLIGKKGAAKTRAIVSEKTVEAEIHAVCADGNDLIYSYTLSVLEEGEERTDIVVEFLDLTEDGYVKYDVIKTKYPENTTSHYPGQMKVDASLVAKAIENSIQKSAGISLTSSAEVAYTEAKDYNFAFNKFNSLVNASYVNSINVEFEGNTYPVVIPGNVEVKFAGASEPSIDNESNENYTLYTYTLNYNLVWKYNSNNVAFKAASTTFTEMLEKTKDEVEKIELTAKENGDNTVTLTLTEKHSISNDVVVGTWTVPAGLSVSCTPEFKIENVVDFSLTGGSQSTVKDWSSKGSKNLANSVSATEIAKTIAVSFNHGTDKNVIISQYETFSVVYNGSTYSAKVNRANLTSSITLSSEVDNNEKTEKVYSVVYTGKTNSNSATASQKWVLVSEKKDNLVNRLVSNEVITLENGAFFRNYNVTPVYSVSGNGNAYAAKMNTNFKVSDNGTIKVYGELGNLSLNSEKTANLSVIKNDSVEGNRTKTTSVYSINDQFPSLYTEIDGIVKLYGTDLMTLVPSTSAVLNKTNETFKSGLYTVEVYNIVYTITVDGKSVQHSQRLENYIINLDPTIDGLEVDPAYYTSFARTDVYNTNRSAHSVVDAGIFREIANPGVKHFCAFDANGTVLVNMIIDESKLGLIAQKSGYCSLLRLDDQQPAVLYGRLTSNDYKAGFEYKSITTGSINTFSNATITLEGYTCPLYGTLVKQEGYYQMGGDKIYK